jgi:hypothetical protein
MARGTVDGIIGRTADFKFDFSTFGNVNMHPSSQRVRKTIDLVPYYYMNNFALSLTMNPSILNKE